MQQLDTQSELYERAKKRVEDIKGFYVHVGVYVIVNAALFAINMITSPDSKWFYWPLLGWGIALGIHAFAFFVEGRWLGPEWQQRKVEEIVAREERQLKKGA